MPGVFLTKTLNPKYPKLLEAATSWARVRRGPTNTGIVSLPLSFRVQGFGVANSQKAGPKFWIFIDFTIAGIKEAADPFL